MNWLWLMLIGNICFFTGFIVGFRFGIWPFTFKDIFKDK